MSGRRYTVFVEISTDDDPPWDVYRHVTAATIDIARAKAVRIVMKDLELPKEFLRSTKVFPGHIEEITE